MPREGREEIWAALAAPTSAARAGPAAAAPQSLRKLKEPKALVRCREVDVPAVKDAIGKVGLLCPLLSTLAFGCLVLQL